ncbi:chemotaxis protein CheW [Trichocoleus desertorum AS-A10]|uniref:chemotaxis protein CheW n=1 Tax=Trichocoleus desertorum TaxID=1481672 RepID=UPI003297F814
MLMLLFAIDDERYALESQQVVEVLPLIGLTKPHQAPAYVSGLLRYRGHMVPVVDLCQLVRRRPCRSYLSTRIIVARFLSAENQTQILGLLAERVTQTFNTSSTTLVPAGMVVDTAPYLGKKLMDTQGVIQCLDVEHLLSPVQLPPTQVIDLPVVQ